MKTILVCTQTSNSVLPSPLKGFLAGAACLGLLAVSSAMAEPEGGEVAPQGESQGAGEGGHHHGKMGERFKRMDANDDEKISKEELFAMPRLAKIPEEKRGQLFARLDRDGDGSLSRREVSEMRRHAEKRRWEKLRLLDMNGSGGVDFDEFGQSAFFQKIPEVRRKQIFERMDSDDDGQITAGDKPKGPPHRRHDYPE